MISSSSFYETLTNTDDFLFADGRGVNFFDKLLDGDIRILIHVWINIGLQRLEVIYGGKDDQNSRLNNKIINYYYYYCMYRMVF